jgi:Zn-dependent protease
LDALQQILLNAPMLLFAMVAHEYAHGYAALKQGDTTAYALGRLTWNPIKHIDPVMTILMPLLTGYTSNWQMMFGGAKPVPVNPRNYKHYKRGDIIVSLAGVATNFVIAIACVLAIILFGVAGRGIPAAGQTFAILQQMMVFGVTFNLLLVFFNLLPIPPLDGSHVIKYLLPPAWALQYQRIGSYGIVILLLLLTVGRGVLAFWLSPINILLGIAYPIVNPFLLRGPW